MVFLSKPFKTLVLLVFIVFLENEGSKGLQGVWDALQLDLQDVVILVRGKLSKMQQMTLGAMTTLDVHARDVVQLLIDDRIDSVDTFSWTSQLRYYWYDTSQS